MIKQWETVLIRTTLNTGARITTKSRPREVEGEQMSNAEQHVQRRITRKTTPSQHTVAVTTLEALDGHREKTMLIASGENDTSNWVRSSSAGVLDVTQCDFSTGSARDEMRGVVGSSAPDVIVGSDKNQNRGCRKKDKDHVKFMCELYDAQAARGRYFVLEPASVVNPRM